MYYNTAKSDVPIKDKLYLSISEASLYTGLARSTIEKLIRSEYADSILLYPLTRGRKTLLKKKELEKFLETRTDVIRSFL